MFEVQEWGTLDTDRGVYVVEAGNIGLVKNENGDWDRLRCNDERVHAHADYCWDDERQVYERWPAERRRRR